MECIVQWIHSTSLRFLRGEGVVLVGDGKSPGPVSLCEGRKEYRAMRAESSARTIRHSTAGADNEKTKYY